MPIPPVTAAPRLLAPEAPTASPGGIPLQFETVARDNTAINVPQEMVEPLKTEDTSSATRKEALGKAKEANGIPRSASPDATIKPVTEEGQHLDQRNIREYEYTNSKGEKITIREDKPITYPDGGKQPHHFNVGPKGSKLKQHHNIEPKVKGGG